MLCVALEEGESSDRLRRLLVLAGGPVMSTGAGELQVSMLSSLCSDSRRLAVGPGDRPRLLSVLMPAMLTWLLVLSRAEGERMKQAKGVVDVAVIDEWLRLHAGRGI